MGRAIHLMHELSLIVAAVVAAVIQTNKIKLVLIKGHLGHTHLICSRTGLLRQEVLPPLLLREGSKP